MSDAPQDWVREGTPRGEDTDWRDEPTEYGSPLSPLEWDDYSSEQSVPVAPPHPRPERAVVETAEESSVVEPDPEVVADGVAAGEFDASPDVNVVGAEHLPHPDVSPEVVVEEVEDLPADESVVHAPTADISPEELFADGDVVLEEAEPAEVVADAALPEGHVDVPDPEVGGFEVASSAAEDVAADAEVPSELSDEGSAIVATDAKAPEADSLDRVDVEQDEVELGSVAAEPDVEQTTADVVDTADDSDSTEYPTAADLPEDPTVSAPDAVEVDSDATRIAPAALVAGGAAVVAAAAAGTSSANTLPDGLYREGALADETAVISAYPDADEQEAEQRKLAAQLAAERQARDERLGVVQTSDENAVRDARPAFRSSTDRFFGAFGLFVLRLITASILGVVAYQILTNVDGAGGTAEFLSQTRIPEPTLVAWILGFTLAALALLLVIGMLQRVVGFLLLLIAVGSLIFIRWGNFSPFQAGVEGFIGDKDLLLAGVGFLLLSLGGGSWGIDGAFRRARAAAKAEQQG